MCALVLADGCAENYVDKGGTLRLALADQVGGYSVAGGERYCFAAEVVDTLAGRYDKSLTVSPKLSVAEIKEGLDGGTIDMATILTSNRVELHRYPSERLYTTHYVVMLPSWKATTDGATAEQLCRGGRIAVSEGFRHTAAYDSLRNDGATKLDTTRYDLASLAKRLAQGKCSAIVCEQSEAKLVEEVHSGLRVAARFDEEVAVSLIFSNMRLKRSLGAVLREFTPTDHYAAMKELYFGTTNLESHFESLTYRPTAVIDGISVWDSKIRTISEQVGVDWRLMSAMACYESNFRENLISEAGAVGLMQVTPIVAREFNMEGCDLADTDTNISLAARLIRKNSRTLGFGPSPQTYDHAAIVVASYHCGVTRTLEAQRLVEAEGGDRGSWEDVSTVLRNMGNLVWLETSGCRFGRFRDWDITLAYTNRVIEKYKHYCLAVPF